MIKGGHDRGEQGDQGVTHQDVIVQDGHRDVAVLTPEQVEAARAYVDASRAASTRAKYR